MPFFDDSDPALSEWHPAGRTDAGTELIGTEFSFKPYGYDAGASPPASPPMGEGPFAAGLAPEISEPPRLNGAPGVFGGGGATARDKGEKTSEEV